MTNDSKTQVKLENSPQLNKEINQQKSSNSENDQPNFIKKIKTFIASWQFKLTVILISIISILLIIFFWKHIVATQGLKGWARHAQAQPIDCMMRDTNNDQYISCTAKLDQQIVPLECGTDIFNMGCRVNYGNALPTQK
jgi:hypothetical protein